MSVETLGSPILEAPAPAGRSHVLRRLMRDKVAATATVVLTLVVLGAICAPLIAPYDPYFTDLTIVMEYPLFTPSADGPRFFPCRTGVNSPSRERDF